MAGCRGFLTSSNLHPSCDFFLVGAVAEELSSHIGLCSLSATGIMGDMDEDLGVIIESSSALCGVLLN